MPSLLGIFASNTERGIEYTITTDTVEIILTTNREPEIFWYDSV